MSLTSSDRLNFSEAVGIFWRDVKYAFRSLAAAKGVTLTVVLTLALGIGANAAIFTLVRGVLLRPLVNRDENRLIYIRQSARGVGTENTVFSVPEMLDLRQRVKSLSAIGDFSTIGFTMNGLGEPREVQAGVVGGNYFDVMGLRPVLGRLLDMRDDGPKAAGAVVLTYRFWTKALKSDPSVLGKSGQVGIVRAAADGNHRRGVGAIHPVSGRNRDHRQRRDQSAPSLGHHGDRPDPSHDRAVWPAGPRRDAGTGPRRSQGGARRHDEGASGSVSREGGLRHRRDVSARPDYVKSQDRALGAAGGFGIGLHHRLLQRSQPDFGADDSPRRRIGDSRRAGREHRRPAPRPSGGKPAALRRGRGAGRVERPADGGNSGAICVALLGPRARSDGGFQHAMGGRGAGAELPRLLLAFVPRLPSGDRQNGIALSSGSLRIAGGGTRRLRAFAVTQIAASFLLLAGAAMLLKTLLALQAVQTGIDTRRVLSINVPVTTYGRTDGQVVDFYKEAMRRVHQLPGVDGIAMGMLTPWREGGNFGPGFQFTAEGYVRATKEDDPRGQFRTVTPGFFAALGVPMIAGRDFNDLDRKDSEPVTIISQSVAQTDVSEPGSA